MAEAAKAYEELAHVCRAPRHRGALCYKAATLWLSLEDRKGASEGVALSIRKERALPRRKERGKKNPKP